MSPVIVRAPTIGEIERAAYVAQVAFNTPDLEPWISSYRWLADNRRLDYLVVVEVDGQIVSSLACTPGSAYFGNDIVPLSAVGGVATLPDYRKSGYATMMMDRAVRMLYQNGWYTSALWPFSYHYYRKFGWEVGSEQRKYTIPVDVAAELGSTSGVRPARAGDLPAISRLVDRFARRYNCVTVRDDLWWSCLNAGYKFEFGGRMDPRTSRCPWVHETSGVIDGYAFFSMAGEGENRFVEVKELIADTPKARQALISSLAVKGIPNVTVSAPIDDGFLQEIPNPRLTEASICAGFQFRVINPPAALMLRSVDTDIEGTLGFDISDPVLRSFSFDIEIADGAILEANIRASERLSMDIQTFSQLYSGYISPVRAAELGRIQRASDYALSLAGQIFDQTIPFRSGVELG